jgi:hypothetical protein
MRNSQSPDYKANTLSRAVVLQLTLLGLSTLLAGQKQVELFAGD